MRDADVSVKENDWDNAFRLWKGVYDSKKGKLRSYSAFNIALYNEMKDNVPEALKWLDLAEENIKHKVITSRRDSIVNSEDLLNEYPNNTVLVDGEHDWLMDDVKKTTKIIFEVLDNNRNNSNGS